MYIFYIYTRINIIHLFSLPIVLPTIELSLRHFSPELLQQSLNWCLHLHPCLPAICQIESNKSILLRNKANHVTLLLKIFQWFPIPLRVKIKVLIMAYKVPEELCSACLLGLISWLSFPVFSAATSPQYSVHSCPRALALTLPLFPRYPHGWFSFRLPTQVCLNVSFSERLSRAPYIKQIPLPQHLLILVYFSS